MCLMSKEKKIPMTWRDGWMTFEWRWNILLWTGFRTHETFSIDPCIGMVWGDDSEQGISLCVFSVDEAGVFWLLWALFPSAWTRDLWVPWNGSIYQNKYGPPRIWNLSLLWCRAGLWRICISQGWACNFAFFSVSLRLREWFGCILLFATSDLCAVTFSLLPTASSPGQVLGILYLCVYHHPAHWPFILRKLMELKIWDNLQERQLLE